MTTRSAGRLKDTLPVLIVALLLATFAVSLLGLARSADATSRANDTTGGTPPPVITEIIGNTPTPMVTPSVIVQATSTPHRGGHGRATATPRPTPRATLPRPIIPFPRCVALFLAKHNQLSLRNCSLQIVITPSFLPLYPHGLQFLVGASRHGNGIVSGDVLTVALVKGYKDGRFSLVVTHADGSEAKSFSPPITAKPPVGSACWTLQVQVTHKVTKNHKVQTTTVFENVKPPNTIKNSGIYRWVKVSCRTHK